MGDCFQNWEMSLCWQQTWLCLYLLCSTTNGLSQIWGAGFRKSLFAQRLKTLWQAEVLNFAYLITYVMLLKLNCRHIMCLFGTALYEDEMAWTTIRQGIAMCQCHRRSWGQEKRCICWRNLFFFSLGPCEGIYACSRSLLVRHSDSATVTAAILLSDVGTSQRSDKSETDVINRCDVRNLPQIHSGVIAVVCCDSWHYCWCWWWFGDIKQTMICICHEFESRWQ